MVGRQIADDYFINRNPFWTFRQRWKTILCFHRCSYSLASIGSYAVKLSLWYSLSRIEWRCYVDGPKPVLFEESCSRISIYTWMLHSSSQPKFDWMYCFTYCRQFNFRRNEVWLFWTINSNWNEIFWFQNHSVRTWCWLFRSKHLQVYGIPIFRLVRYVYMQEIISTADHGLSWTSLSKSLPCLGRFMKT